MVQQLVEEYEYDLEASIDAARICEGSLEKAMDYLAGKDIENREDVHVNFDSASPLNDKENPTKGYVLIIDSCLGSIF